MAETLGTLCDKLTVLQLKHWHSEDEHKRASLARQSHELQAEVDELMSSALAGNVPLARLHYASHKVYKREGNETPPVTGSIGSVAARLAQVNCELWHEQEKVYAFETVPPAQKDVVVKRLAVLNLERNQCIDAIDRSFQRLVQRRLEETSA